MFVEGKIKKYDTERGFGFIKVDGHQTDVFFHIKDFPKDQNWWFFILYY